MPPEAPLKFSLEFRPPLEASEAKELLPLFNAFARKYYGEQANLEQDRNKDSAFSVIKTTDGTYAFRVHAGDDEQQRVSGTLDKAMLLEFLLTLKDEKPKLAAKMLQAFATSTTPLSPPDLLHLNYRHTMRHTKELGEKFAQEYDQIISDLTEKLQLDAQGKPTQELSSDEHEAMVARMDAILPAFILAEQTTTHAKEELAKQTDSNLTPREATIAQTIVTNPLIQELMVVDKEFASKMYQAMEAIRRPGDQMWEPQTTQTLESIKAQFKKSTGQSLAL